jgi:hypothetical protein
MELRSLKSSKNENWVLKAGPGNFSQKSAAGKCA